MGMRSDASVHSAFYTLHLSCPDYVRLAWIFANLQAFLQIFSCEAGTRLPGRISFSAFTISAFLEFSMVGLTRTCPDTRQFLSAVRYVRLAAFGFAVFRCD
jgi:hypothetical protein